MTWYEILIIVACVLIVGGVAIGSVIRKKKGKSSCCDCASCSHCSQCAERERTEKK